MNMLLNLFAISTEDLDKLIKPIIQLCDVLIPAILSVVGAIGGIYVIILCVKYSKAADPQEHEKAKNGLKNAIIGFVLIFVLLIMLNIGVEVLGKWLTNYDYN